MQQGFQPGPSPYPDQTTAMVNQNTMPVSQDVRRSFLADDYAADSNRLISKKGSKHVRALISTIILVGGLITTLVLYLTKSADLTQGAVIGICVGIYIFYLMLGLICNPLFSYFGNVEHGANFESSYNKTRGLVGHFIFNVQCYHWQTRHHTRTVTDSNGNKRTQHYTTQQKVVTHRATEQLYPKTCEDESGNIDQVRASTDIIFVHNKVNYKFNSEYSRGQYEYAWISFQNRHRFDVHQDYSQNFVIPGLVARMCFYVGQKPKNYSGWLVFWSFFGLIWPYSMYLESIISRYDIEYMKVLGL